MALTDHKTVAMFMRYAHTEDDPVRKAAELVAARRKAVGGGRRRPAAPSRVSYHRYDTRAARSRHRNTAPGHGKVYPFRV